MSVQGQTLLVVNQGDSNVSLIDPATGKTLATVAENTPGVHGHEIAASADGRTAFVPIYGSAGVGKPGIDGHEMLVIDLASRKVVDHIDFGHGVRPHLPVSGSRERSALRDDGAGQGRHHRRSADA